MKTVIPFLFLMNASTFAAIEYPHGAFLSHCLKGYKQSIQVLKDRPIDPLAPKDSTGSQLCLSLFYNDTEFRHFSWVSDAISFLKVPKNEIKLSEFSTAHGNCELGSYFAQRMFRMNISEKESIDFAKKICRNL